MTRRAAIYARYSSENQREASIEDQLEVCRRYLRQQGWNEVVTYEDKAISGASRFRPGFQSLLRDAETRQFDVIVCEAIDRLGRKLADVADFHDRLTFFGVDVHAVSLGLVTQMHIGIMGTMAQLTLSDLRAKTIRGQLGRARLGRIPGGLAYGYDIVPPPPGSDGAGERRINDDEARIVRRIFRDYVAGQSPRQIAHHLNSEKVAGPGGRPWGDTTIRGKVGRGTGILNNTLYIGQLSWNRCSYVKDPRTGKRVARINPAAQREIVDVPDLRIIDQTLWEQARQRHAAVTCAMARDGNGNPLNRSHRVQFLLSGLLRCGCCDGAYTIIGKDRYGCATRRSKALCANSRTVTRQAVERRVLAGLKERLLSPGMVEAFISAFAAEASEQRREATRSRARWQEELADVERRLGGVLAAIENGAWSETLRERLRALEQQKVELMARETVVLPEPAITLHPAAAALYRDKVANLEAALQQPESRVEAAEALRTLIDRVVLAPDSMAADGLRIDLHGDLAVLLTADATGEVFLHGAASPNDKPPLARTSGGLLSVVAGTGFEPVTFRL